MTFYYKAKITLKYVIICVWNFPIQKPIKKLCQLFFEYLKNKQQDLMTKGSGSNM